MNIKDKTKLSNYNNALASKAKLKGIENMSFDSRSGDTCPQKYDEVSLGNIHYTYCGKETLKNLHQVAVDGIKYGCHSQCTKGCTGVFASDCITPHDSCKDFVIDTHNLATCTLTCPVGYFKWRQNKCYQCSKECGMHGCYTTGSHLSGTDSNNLRGCKLCEISVFTPNKEGNYVLTCIKASVNDDKFIEEAFKKYLVKPK